MSIWFITGASRGLGAEIARAALARGHQVIAADRDAARVRAAFPGAGGALLAVPLDVTSPAQITAAVRAATGRFGGIDVMVNNAGHGLLRAVGEATDAEVRSIYDVSVLAMLALTREVLPVMRAAGDGIIVSLPPAAGLAQPGDLARDARVIIDAVDGGTVPARLFSGSGTIDRVARAAA